MILHHRRRLQCRLRHRADQRLGPARRRTGAVDQVDRVVGGGDGAGMGIEDHAVARRNHADAVADDRFARVGARRDAAHQTEGGHLDEGQAVVPRLGLGDNVLGTGGFIRHEDMLGGLMRHTAHAGFGHAELRHDFGFRPGQPADFGDDLFPLFHRHLPQHLIAGR